MISDDEEKKKAVYLTGTVSSQEQIRRVPIWLDHYRNGTSCALPSDFLWKGNESRRSLWTAVHFWDFLCVGKESNDCFSNGSFMK
jgi:hypothetical protein